MKISNETKIGILTAVAITLLYFGFNFLKGKNVFEKNNKIYAIFRNVEGLETSNSVRINGLEIGSISLISEKDKDLSGIVVTIRLKKRLISQEILSQRSIPACSAHLRLLSSKEMQQIIWSVEYDCHP